MTTILSAIRKKADDFLFAIEYDIKHHHHEELKKHLSLLKNKNINKYKFFNIDMGDSLALFCAANKGNEETFQIILDAGADINKRNQYGATIFEEILERTPHYDQTEDELIAIKLSLAKLALNVGFNVNAKGWKGFNALHFTTAIKDKKEFDRHYNRYSRTYDSSVENSNIFFDLVMKYSPDINAITDDKKTVLDLAIESGSEYKVNKLITAGAKASIKKDNIIKEQKFNKYISNTFNNLSNNVSNLFDKLKSNIKDTNKRKIDKNKTIKTLKDAGIYDL